jgi:hypothetical protein
MGADRDVAANAFGGNGLGVRWQKEGAAEAPSTAFPAPTAAFPAQAGIQNVESQRYERVWVPAFAGKEEGKGPCLPTRWHVLERHILIDADIAG